MSEWAAVHVLERQIERVRITGMVLRGQRGGIVSERGKALFDKMLVENRIELLELEICQLEEAIKVKKMELEAQREVLREWEA